MRAGRTMVFGIHYTLGRLRRGKTNLQSWYGYKTSADVNNAVGGLDTRRPRRCEVHCYHNDRRNDQEGLLK